MKKKIFLLAGWLVLKPDIPYQAFFMKHK